LTEEEYELCRDIFRLEVGIAATRPISERRVRLFIHAGAQRVRHLSTRPLLLQAIETAFRFADGLATREELQEGHLAVREAASKSPRQSKWDAALRVILYATTSQENFAAIGMACGHSAECVCQALDLDQHSGTSYSKDSDTFQREMARCCEMFRDLFPYHAPIQSTAPPPWAGGDVALVARAIYEEDRFEDIPVLADALEDADCDRPELIAHCRQPGPHVRGCWAVDFLLGLT
jgi:hypothetical protein